MESPATASAHVSAAEHDESEMRKALDGQPYKREEFDVWYTTASQACWDAAAPVTPSASAAEHGESEMRKGLDGQPYKREEFDLWYTTASQACWDEAQPVTPPPLRPQRPAASSSQLTSGATEHVLPEDGEAVFTPIVILSQADVLALKK